MPAEFPKSVKLGSRLVKKAMDALDKGDLAEHDALVVAAGLELAQEGCDVIALAQFSMARAQALVEKATGLPVLTTPSSAVRVLRQRILNE